MLSSRETGNVKTSFNDRGHYSRFQSIEKCRKSREQKEQEEQEEQKDQRAERAESREQKGPDTSFCSSIALRVSAALWQNGARAGFHNAGHSKFDRSLAQ
jgi:hypothetical protein